MKYYIDNSDQTIEPFKRKITITDTKTDIAGNTYENTISETTFAEVQTMVEAEKQEMNRRITDATASIASYNEKSASQNEIEKTLDIQTLETDFIKSTQENIPNAII